eukprot:1353047-Heterocapsa_arctica.AAC.1
MRDAGGQPSGPSCRTTPDVAQEEDDKQEPKPQRGGRPPRGHGRTQPRGAAGRRGAPRTRVSRRTGADHTLALAHGGHRLCDRWPEELVAVPQDRVGEVDDRRHRPEHARGMPQIKDSG